MRNSKQLGQIALLTASLVGCATTDNRSVDTGATPILAAPPEMTADEVEKQGAPDVPETVVAAEEPITKKATTEKAATGPAADQTVAWPKGVDASPQEVADYGIGSVANRKIALSDLVAKWVWREPERVRAILDDLVLSRIIVFEAARMQIELPDDSIKNAVEVRLKILEADAKASGSPSLEAYIQEALGMEPPVFMRYAQEEAAIDLLAPRCVRSWLLSSDHREIRAITVKTSDEVDQVQARLAQGEPFAEVAKDLSLDPSKDDGGRLPAVVRGSDLLLARTAFAAEVGEVSGPIRDRDGMLFVFVEAAPAPAEGPWSEIGDEVEASLATRDIEDPEFWQWKAQMLSRYEVNMDPFLNLLK